MAVRAQYSARNLRRRGGQGLPGGTTCARIGDRDIRGAAARGGGNRRWAGVPIYLRTGKGSRGRSRRSRSRSARAAPRLQAGGLGPRPAEPDQRRPRVFRSPRGSARACDPPGEHGVPLRHFLPVGVARGVRAPDHGRMPRRTLFTATMRSQWRICDPILEASSQIPGPIPQYPGLGRSGGGQRHPRRGAQVAGDLEEARDVSWMEGVWNAAGHHARQDRGRAARAAQGAAPEGGGLRPRARAQPRRDRGPGVAGRDSQQARAGRAISPVAHDPVRGRAWPQHDRRMDDHERGRRPTPRSSRCATRRSCSRSALSFFRGSTPWSTRSWCPTLPRWSGPLDGHPEGGGRADAHSPGGAARLGERARSAHRSQPRAGARQEGLRGGPRLAPLDAAGGSGSPPASTRRPSAAGPAVVDHRPAPPLEHCGHPLLRLARNTPRLGARDDDGPERLAVRPREHTPRGGERPSSPIRSRTRRGWRASWWRRRRACRCRSTAARAACRPGARRQRARSPPGP